MEEEIDLRDYVRALLRWWWLIAGLALVAVVAALVTSLLLPASYEATALVAVTNPRYTLQFDPRIESVDDAKPVYAAYPQLATSDELLQELLASVDPAPEGIETLADLREILKAKAGADPSLLQLTARSQDSQEAARIANAWAHAFVGRANLLYGTGGDEQVAFFTDQAGQAQTALAEAEQALVEYEGRNEAAELQARLDSAKQELQERLQEQYDIAEAVRKAQALAERVASQPEASRARLADELTALLLQTQLLGLGPSGDAAGRVADSGVTAPVELQLSDAALVSGGQTASELAASLDSLAATLGAQAGVVEERIATLGPEILSLQERLQAAQAEENRLTRERDLAQETYQSLARKVQEARIAAEGQEQEVKLASRAAVPKRPAGARKLFTTGLAGAVGLMLGVFGAFAVEWWRGGRSDTVAGCLAEVPGKPASKG